MTRKRTDKTKTPTIKTLAAAVSALDNPPATVSETGTNDPGKAKPKKPVPIETILHYKKMGLGVNEIARLVNRSPNTISCRLKDVEELENFRKFKDVAMEELQFKLLSSVTDAKLKDASVGTLVTSSAILEDKVRTIRQQPTQIVEYVELKGNLNLLLEQLIQIRQSQQQSSSNKMIENNSPDIIDLEEERNG